MGQEGFSFINIPTYWKSQKVLATRPCVYLSIHFSVNTHIFSVAIDTHLLIFRMKSGDCKLLTVANCTSSNCGQNINFLRASVSVHNMQPILGYYSLFL